MKLAVDLHLHSRYAGHVSPDMTLPNLITCAQQKGLDVLGTGDCLQADWLRDIEGHLFETGAGFLLPRAETYLVSRETLPLHLQRPVRFVLSTEVCCAPPGTPRLHGLHHLLYFRSLESVHRFRQKLLRFGNLADGRPMLTLSSHDLLKLVLDHGDGCEMATAHTLSPWFSALGSVAGGRSLGEIFGDNAARLLAVEVGIPSSPEMYRRISALDRHALICSSDAHSLANLGREYTLLDIEPHYQALMAALRDPASPQLIGFVKYPVRHSGYYYNFCGICEQAQPGKNCRHCGRPLAIGTRDHSGELADRDEPLVATKTSCLDLQPLIDLIASELGLGREAKRAVSFYHRLLQGIGHERYILTEATEAELTNVTTFSFAQTILDQRLSHSHPSHSQQQLCWQF